MTLACEMSLHAEELQQAYDRIGFSQQHSDFIMIEPQEAPDEYILGLHRTAVHASSSPSERAGMHQALLLIGRSRKSTLLQDMAESGQTLLTVDDAYQALGVNRETPDDMIIWSFKSAADDFHGKKDHYVKCLETIANAPGEERPVISNFLQTGQIGFVEEPKPGSMDVPAGLENIGNTCYLNSILQVSIRDQASPRSGVHLQPHCRDRCAALEALRSGAPDSLSPT